MDDELIKKCKENDRGAQRLVFEKYYPKMMSIARRYVVNEVDAIDIINEGFLNVFKYINQFKRKGSFDAWVKKIIVNKAIDFIRKQKNYRDNVILNEANANLYFGESELPSDLGVEELYKMIDQLSPMSKMVFNMYAIDGYSHSEIGKKLNVRPGTSRWHLNAARKQLQKMLKEVSNITVEE